MIVIRQACDKLVTQSRESHVTQSSDKQMQQVCSFRLQCIVFVDIPKSPKTGDIVAAVVTNVLPELGLYVSMATLYEGRVHVTDISDRFKKNPTAKFKKGDFVR